MAPASRLIGCAEIGQWCYGLKGEGAYVPRRILLRHRQSLQSSLYPNLDQRVSVSLHFSKGLTLLKRSKEQRAE